MKLLDKELLKSNIDKVAEYDLSENNIFGSAYIVKQKGETVYKKCFGVTDINSTSPVKEDTIFRLASMTKPITAVAVLILIDRGLIALEDEVKKYIPEFEDIHIVTKDGTDLGKTGTDVTIKHLLTHTSGFGSIEPYSLTVEEKANISGTINHFIKSGLDFEPNTRQEYSAFAAWDVLVAIIEKLSGEDYTEFLKKEIFEPCNMKDTTFTPSDEQWNRMITMHNKADGKNAVGTTTPLCVFENFPCSHKLGGAGLASTLEDYSRFAQMLLNKGKTEDKRIVSEELIKLMGTPHVSEDIMPWSERWGLGVRVITEAGDLPVGAYGWSGAYGSHFWVDPENEITAVFMKNSKFDGGAGNKSARRFEKAVHDSFK